MTYRIPGIHARTYMLYTYSKRKIEKIRSKHNIKTRAYETETKTL